MIISLQPAYTIESTDPFGGAYQHRTLRYWRKRKAEAAARRLAKLLPSCQWEVIEL